MKDSTKQKNTYAFIDSQNLYKGVKQAGWELDFGRFRKYLRGKYGVEQAYLFIGFIPGNSVLYSYLQRVGYILVFKPILEIKKGKTVEVKGNVDAELVLHTMIHYPKYDKAIIVSGDGDFHCLIEYLEDQEKLGKVITPNQRYSSLLRRFADYIAPISNAKGKVEKVKKA
ncbi:MAG: NYN domain-containing protein [Candidatus Doudnabacteria bacterium]|nr:NYN domain-containing protein [Candidatus Doudnabacteria bacterium]